MAKKTAQPTEESDAGKFSFTATCKCGASNTVSRGDKETAKSDAVSKIYHKDGCTNDLTVWQAHITVEEN